MAIKRNYVKRQSLAGSMKYRSWENWAIGDVAIGEVVGFFMDTYDKKGFKLKIEEANFEDGTGNTFLEKTVAINSMGSIVDAIEELEVGMMIQVEYTGKTPVQKGKFAGKDCHTANIDVLAIDTGAEESAEEDI